MGKVHGSLARAGKVEPAEKPKTAKGRAYKRLIYTRHFTNLSAAPAGKHAEDECWGLIGAQGLRGGRELPQRSPEAHADSIRSESVSSGLQSFEPESDFEASPDPDFNAELDLDDLEEFHLPPKE
ncbi:hypothetical protein F4823DRAFT_223761 [Ustulina deusta]|nr:hypothetical protein F4823DRAFT_223761 [Ustulina deusta]